MSAITDQPPYRGILPQHAGVCEPGVRLLAREVLTQIGDKWTSQVISSLAEGPLRFGALQSEVQGISHRMLTRTLRSLERDGLVSRTAYAETPPRVEYELTALGETLIVPIAGILAWVGAHQAEVEANRARFEA
jgi:DNA-binding HxlR family transcriptional regulator